MGGSADVGRGAPGEVTSVPSPKPPKSATPTGAGLSPGANTCGAGSTRLNERTYWPVGEKTCTVEPNASEAITESPGVPTTVRRFRNSPGPCPTRPALQSDFPEESKALI